MAETAPRPERASLGETSGADRVRADGSWDDDQTGGVAMLGRDVPELKGVEVRVLGHSVVQPKHLLAAPYAVFMLVTREAGATPIFALRRWSELRKLLDILVRNHQLDKSKLPWFQAHAGMRFGPMTLDNTFLDSRMAMMQRTLTELLSFYSTTSLQQSTGPPELLAFLRDGGTPQRLILHEALGAHASKILAEDAESEASLLAREAIASIISNALATAEYETSDLKIIETQWSTSSDVLVSPQQSLCRGGVDSAAMPIGRMSETPAKQVPMHDEATPTVLSSDWTTSTVDSPSNMQLELESDATPAASNNDQTSSTAPFASPVYMQELSDCATVLSPEHSLNMEKESAPHSEQQPSFLERKPRFDQARSGLTLASLAACAILALLAMILAGSSTGPNTPHIVGRPRSAPRVAVGALPAWTGPLGTLVDRATPAPAEHASKEYIQKTEAAVRPLLPAAVRPLLPPPAIGSIERNWVKKLWDRVRGVRNLRLKWRMQRPVNEQAHEQSKTAHKRGRRRIALAGIPFGLGKLLAKSS